MSDNNEKLHVLDDEKDLLLDHDYDGIQELNHPLPSWWVWMWAASIVFSIPYFMYYHMAGGPSLAEALEKDMVKINELKAVAANDLSKFDIEHYNTWVENNDAKALAATVWEENCLSCHAADGGGDIGPNLTDNYWLNITERTPQAIFKVVRDGVEDNGMPAWGEVLSKEEIYAAITQVMAFKGTTPAEPKEPQGEKIE
ncbi:cbb3-type cytochrome c oxidase N-terminal domain-containing protein [Halobacteriovorax sp. HLS]|uniref:cbb3-type cytochrome c oxidase N-terminal domain-containing protein n=1 Tax=Halobacteriovorax sp. HLS TaxID=2234000 RepID=UPI000FD92964|nr:cbb3-type cytochrome c oxidase N-terminal domain-containing protein [Halobacteriovorax sp. HLS]